jgi:hypothetical protein
MKMRWAWNVALTGRRGILIGLARSRRRYKIHLRIDLKEMRNGGVEWFHLAHDGDQLRTRVTAIMNLRVP